MFIFRNYYIFKHNKGDLGMPSIADKISTIRDQLQFVLNKSFIKSFEAID